MDDNKYKNMSQGFTMISNKILFNKKFQSLHSTPKNVYFSLLIFSNGKGKDVWPSINTLCEICNTSERTIQRSLTCLEKSGFISIIEQPGKSNKYTFNDTPDISKGVTSMTERGDISVGGGVTSMTSELPSNVVPINQSSVRTIPKNHTKNKTGKEVCSLDKKRENFRNWIEDGLHIILNIGCLEIIAKLSLEQMEGVWLLYERLSKEGKIKNVSSWWNLVALKKGFDFSDALAIRSHELAQGNNPIRTKNKIMAIRHDKKTATNKSAVAAYRVLNKNEDARQIKIEKQRTLSTEDKAMQLEIKNIRSNNDDRS